MAASSATRPRATYADIEALPDTLVGEILDGVLHTQGRPAIRHALAASALLEELGPPFKRGRGGPGGWMILIEPELHLGFDVLVPDLAGWRRERMTAAPDVVGCTVAPDWIGEVLSPSTAGKDRSKKMPIYAREGVAHVWLVDPTARTLEIFRLDGETYRLVATHEGDATVRAEPFDAIELALLVLWAP